MRSNGVLPEYAPQFGEDIDADLAEYGFSVLRASLALMETGQASEKPIWQDGFRKAASAFESLVRNGDANAPDHGFLSVIGATAYHLAGYSAMAYSLINQHYENSNMAPIELALSDLILRNLKRLQARSKAWLLNQGYSDSELAAKLSASDIDSDDAIATILTSTIFRAFAYYDFALLTGDNTLKDQAFRFLKSAVSLASKTNSVSIWWIARLSMNIITDLWTKSMHVVLPQEGPIGSVRFPEIRELFIGSLYNRDSADVELWPSQLIAAKRASDISDNLVVSIPTSAGKTRIAEIAALMSLSVNKRVLILTPLRALSAQMERIFRNTFSPLGYTVSSLYGANGMVLGDEDALRNREIVIATPEKLDFALRNDSTLIDDVGLIILDEGHMIGPEERELRFEVLIQRLLRRKDAVTRRIVCLSAILPEGEQLNDLTNWIRGDVPGTPIVSKWRPTRQRYGTLEWWKNSALLQYDVEGGGPYIRRFVEAKPAILPDRSQFPKNKLQLTIAAAWEFALRRKSVLIYCTQRTHVEAYAKEIVKLIKRGYLPSLLTDNTHLKRIIAIGEEWLGQGNPVVECLRYGIAIHHGRLPNPFLRELEKLLAERALKMTVASPTLAQGLNLNASVLLVPNIYRSKWPISGEEFSNVTGRAGRAFVDIEGLIIHTIYDKSEWRRRQWKELVNTSKMRSLESGLILLVGEIIDRLANTGVLSRDDAMQYLANAREAWDAPAELDGQEPIAHLLEKLDRTILGLIDALDSDAESLPQLIDEVLNGSLWARQISRLADPIQMFYRQILDSRARIIWSNTNPGQRHVHFAMGVGLESGLAIDAMADDLSGLLDAADDAALRGDVQILYNSLISIAEMIFNVHPFIPKELSDDWKNLLLSWISGVEMDLIGPVNVKIIEDAFSYSLVWALEAIRMRRKILGGRIGVGSAAAALEAGLPQFMMAMLVRSGLPSRRAALVAITDTTPVFVDRIGMVEWLRSQQVEALTDRGDWPTPDSAAIWRQFRTEMLIGRIQRWSIKEWQLDVDQGSKEVESTIGLKYRIQVDNNGSVWVCKPDFQKVIRIEHFLDDQGPSLFHAYFSEETSKVTVRRIGQGEATWINRE